MSIPDLAAKALFKARNGTKKRIIAERATRIKERKKAITAKTGTNGTEWKKRKNEN